MRHYPHDHPPQPPATARGACLLTEPGRASICPNKKGAAMVALLLLLLLIAILFGVGFTAHLLWVAAVVLLIVWLIGFVARGADRRWYRW